MKKILVALVIAGLFSAIPVGLTAPCKITDDETGKTLFKGNVSPSECEETAESFGPLWRDCACRFFGDEFGEFECYECQPQGYCLCKNIIETA